MLAPIILFVYNRPKHTSATLQALAANDLANESVIYIYADGAKENATPIDLKKIDDTRQVIKQHQWCKEVHIILSVSNNGLANSVINGVTQIVNQYGKVIVLEDDLVTSKGFLKYMNTALDKYKDENKVMQISGHQFPVEKWERNNEAFFLPFTTSWGWATWKRAWKFFDAKAIGFEKLKTDFDLRNRFDLNGSNVYSAMLESQMVKKSIDSWAIRWWWSVFLKKGLILFPDYTLIRNIGFDIDATHTKSSNQDVINFDLNYSISDYPEKILIDNIRYSEVSNRSRQKENSENSNQNKFNPLSRLKKIIKDKIKFHIKSKVASLSDTDLELLVNKYQAKKVRDMLLLITHEDSSVIHNESSVNNFSNDSAKISIGKNTHIRGNLQVFAYGGSIEIGNNCYVGELSYIWSGEKIVIGNNVLISHQVNIIDSNSHELNAQERVQGYLHIISKGHPTEKGSILTSPIIINDNAWISFGVIILKGITIGEGAVVAAGSVVTKNVAPYTLVAGNPARYIKDLPR